MSLMKRILLSTVVALSLSCGYSGLSPREEADRFLAMYDGIGQKLYAVTSEAYWKSATAYSDFERRATESKCGLCPSSPW